MARKTLLKNDPVCGEQIRQDDAAAAAGSIAAGSAHLTLASAKASLRAIARRWLLLDAEIKQHDAHLEVLTAAQVPDLLEARGIATGTAAEMLLLVGDNPERIHSEAAFAKLCGACPIPASSGKTIRHRLNRGGNRQANAALYRVVIVRMRGISRHWTTFADALRRASPNPRSSAASNATSLVRSSGIFAPRQSWPLCPQLDLDQYRSINALAETINGLYKT
jgi:transposase